VPSTRVLCVGFRVVHKYLVPLSAYRFVGQLTVMENIFVEKRDSMSLTGSVLYFHRVLFYGLYRTL